jgi:predicted small lipoprotein YifL
MQCSLKLLALIALLAGLMGCGDKGVQSPSATYPAPSPNDFNSSGGGAVDK